MPITRDDGPPVYGTRESCSAERDHGDRTRRNAIVHVLFQQVERSVRHRGEHIGGVARDVMGHAAAGQHTDGVDARGIDARDRLDLRHEPARERDVVHTRRTEYCPTFQPSGGAPQTVGVDDDAGIRRGCRSSSSARWIPTRRCHGNRRPAAPVACRCTPRARARRSCGSRNPLAASGSCRPRPTWTLQIRGCAPPPPPLPPPPPPPPPPPTPPPPPPAPVGAPVTGYTSAREHPAVPATTPANTPQARAAPPGLDVTTTHRR